MLMAELNAQHQHGAHLKAWNIYFSQKKFWFPLFCLRHGIPFQIEALDRVFSTPQSRVEICKQQQSSK